MCICEYTEKKLFLKEMSLNVILVTNKMYKNISLQQN